MPEHMYVEPASPRLLDRLLAHPYEYGLSVVLALIGGMLLADQRTWPRSFEILPVVGGYLFAWMAVAAGLSVILGLTWRKAYRYGLEKIGLFFSAGLWATYGLALAERASTIAGLFLVAVFGALAGSSFVRFLATRQTARERLERLRIANRVLGNG